MGKGVDGRGHGSWNVAGKWMVDGNLGSKVDCECGIPIAAVALMARIRCYENRSVVRSPYTLYDDMSMILSNGI